MHGGHLRPLLFWDVRIRLLYLLRVYLVRATSVTMLRCFHLVHDIFLYLKGSFETSMAAELVYALGRQFWSFYLVSKKLVHMKYNEQ